MTDNRYLAKHIVWGARLIALCILSRQYSGVELANNLRSKETMLENYRHPCYARNQTVAN